MPLSAGMRLGPYEILSALGAGGMGEVYRVRDTKLGRGVATSGCCPRSDALSWRHANLAVNNGATTHRPAGGPAPSGGRQQTRSWLRGFGLKANFEDASLKCLADAD